jgi:4-coumarate--CoA ligase
MPYKSPFPPFELPNLDLPYLWFESKESSLTYPKDHIITQDAVTEEGYSWQDIRTLGHALGRGLKKHLNIKKGEVICIYSTNHVNFLLAALT